MNFVTFKTTQMHWQERQSVTVRFEEKRIENDMKSQATGEQTA